MEDTLAFQVYQLLRANKISIDKQELVFQIKSHPSYPSLHAVTGVLDHFGIDNLALDVPVTKEVLEQLPSGFLAQIMRDDKPVFAVVSKKRGDYVVSISVKEKLKLTTTQFLNVFSGILVAVEKNDEVEASRYEKKVRQPLLVTLLLLAILGLFISAFPGIQESIFLTVALLGGLLSYAIVQQEQGVETSLGNAFCSGISEKRDCLVVVQSDGGTLFGKFKLSTSSMIYFSGLLLSGLLLTLSNGKFSPLYVLSFMALPITIYSIYYQLMVVKKWCALCLGIVVVLWVLAGISFIGTTGSTAMDFQVSELLMPATGFVIASVFWLWLLPNYTLLKELTQLKVEAFKFKRNFQLFKALLDKSQPVSTEIDYTGDIVFGDKQAALTLTVVTNPFCGHCKAVHTLIEDLLKKYDDRLKILIRFGVNPGLTDSHGTIVALRLLELFDTRGAAVCLEAMHEIYGVLDVSDWIEKWGTSFDDERYLAILKKGTEWTKKHQINFTPEILINGRSYPKEYDRRDLIYFIEELEEECRTSNETAIPLTETI